jgi:hypothetical protein
MYQDTKMTLRLLSSPYLKTRSPLTYAGVPKRDISSCTMWYRHCYINFKYIHASPRKILQKYAIQPPVNVTRQENQYCMTLILHTWRNSLSWRHIVSLLMGFHWCLHYEVLMTYFTLVWPYAWMAAFVNWQGGGLCELFTACVTYMRPITCMYEQMQMKRRINGKCIATYHHKLPVSHQYGSGGEPLVRCYWQGSCQRHHTEKQYGILWALVIIPWAWTYCHTPHSANLKPSDQ